MASSTAATDEEATLTHLTRLSQKPGVSSTLILSRSTGAIVRSTGLLSIPLASSSSPQPSQIPQSPLSGIGTPAHDPTSFSTSIGLGSGNANISSNGTKEKKRTTAEEIAALIWNFVQAAGSLVDGMAAAAALGPGGGGIGLGNGASGSGGALGLEDGEEADEVKLLRVRTKRFECVVVPDSKYLLVVVHDTPAA